MNPHRFFAERKRRNVYKVAVAYAVVAWLLIQAPSILFSTLEAPASVMKGFATTVFRPIRISDGLTENQLSGNLGK